MEESKNVMEWKRMVYPVLHSKVEEFQLLGYPNAHEEGIWKCMVEKVWKGKPEKRLHQIVQDIFHLNIGTYMSYLTIQAYQGNEDLMTSIKALSGPIHEQQDETDENAH
ncbi:post-transcriptional regulator [Pontibacillus salicampi]|uniref:Post-transcriptional regulator n=1 Tax=Pontibacillus salicampi TaxID=1449801 RepID=A0ABV6LJB5_9BACI